MVLNANQQHRFIPDLARAGIKDRMGGIGPVLGREDRIGRMTMEELYVEMLRFRFLQHRSFLDYFSADSISLGAGNDGLASVAERGLEFHGE